MTRASTVIRLPAGQLPAVLTVLWAVGLLWLEFRKPLRPVQDSKLRRGIRNGVIAACAGAVVQALEVPAALAASNLVAAYDLGVTRNLPMPQWARAVISVLLLDYTLYLWHVMTHRVPFLWRFHRVHHMDREMDATTALRFHFGEMTLSVPFRVMQVLVIGPTLAQLSAWQSLLFVSILFHHSNVRIGKTLERWLQLFVVTPRLHEIHHSVAPQEENSNWSSGLTIWDALHGTLRRERLPTDPLTIGVAGHLGDEDVRLSRVLKAPFVDAGFRT